MLYQAEYLLKSSTWVREDCARRGCRFNELTGSIEITRRALTVMPARLYTIGVIWRFPRIGCMFSRSVHLCFLTFTFVLLGPQAASQAGDSGLEKLYAEAKAAEAAADFTTAEAKYNDIVKIAPRLGPAYNNLGLFYFKQREFDKAVLVLERGLKVDPKMASASALLGISLYELGRYADAKAPLEKAVSASPNDNNAEMFLARDLVKLEDNTAAAKHLEKLTQREPKDQEVWYLLGKVYMKLSEQALGQMNAIDPNSVFAHETSGEIMESMKNYEGAIIEYKKAVEIAPNQAGTHYLLGNAYWNMAEWNAATEQFQAELASDPHNCMAQWKLGNILLEQNVRSEDALAEIEKALTACPNLNQARVDHARALLKLNRSAEALPDLQAAVKASPDEPTIHFLLAQVYRSTGRVEQARSEMQVYSKLEESARAATEERAQEAIKNKEEAEH